MTLTLRSRLHVWLCAGVYVSVYISVFDYGSGEATGPRWPRRPQASQVSELSIPRWLLHSCENRKAALTTNTRGTGGKTANLWANQQQEFSLSLSAGFVPSLFSFFPNWRLNGKSVPVPAFPPLFSFYSFGVVFWEHMLPAKKWQLCLCVPVHVYLTVQRLGLSLFFFFPPRRVWNSRLSGLGFALCK